ncbi:uncharacterized protein ARMOST_19850 [Armillaria ostoyae]|uniref:Uncharacterized protein n=1 Tax=Armillaria ostoyae TaxID=47428 RepID=A0A284S5P9_ARMOS|nr:uncharacterized protein ARMOST_19850 [Armillaria ostoyae]
MKIPVDILSDSRRQSARQHYSRAKPANAQHLPLLFTFLAERCYLRSICWLNNFTAADRALYRHANLMSPPRSS